MGTICAGNGPAYPLRLIGSREALAGITQGSRSVFGATAIAAPFIACAGV
jgi:hypothetical protein